MSIKATKKMYDFPYGSFCGVFMDEKTMKKLAKLLYKQNQEIKELLTTNIDSIEVSSWTLAYPNGKQESIHYTGQQYTTKEERIKLIDKTSSVSLVDHLYFGSREEAIAEHMKLYDESTPVEV